MLFPSVFSKTVRWGRT